ncbi:MAG: hypothetical protein KDD77_00405, partial [Caldilineaceae bacterium]|nr:hypothetical protein [Caldilineaceae bacterium]
MSLPWFYPDKVSAEPDETVAIHASSLASPCTLIVSRVGRTIEEVARFDAISIREHPTPTDADTNGCGWPEVFSFRIEADWRPGYYDLALTDPDGQTSHHFICIRRKSGSKKCDAVIILATNTYAAYNYWGGSNAYADVKSLMAGEVTADESRDGAIGRLSRLRPYPQLQIAPPADVPRLINYNRRAPGEMPFPGDPAWSKAHHPSPYDGSAGFLHKWEHRFAAWAETNGYEIDYLTDHDFVGQDQDLLSGYKAVLVVGHSEYWSGDQRFTLEKFVHDGGNLAIFSGNTCYWKVRWEDAGDTLVAHKWRGELDDPLWADPETRPHATHLWSHEAFGQPEAQLTGLSFVYGGYHRICMCVARGSAGFTVYRDLHWALEGTDLYYGDVIGSDVPLIGYENDGCPIRFGPDGLPVA